MGMTSDGGERSETPREDFFNPHAKDKDYGIVPCRCVTSSTTKVNSPSRSILSTFIPSELSTHGGHSFLVDFYHPTEASNPEERVKSAPFSPLRLCERQQKAQAHNKAHYTKSKQPTLSYSTTI